MMRYIKLQGSSFVVADGAKEAMWIHTENPTPEELDEFCQLTGLPGYLLEDIRDEDEMSHVDTYAGNTVIFLDAPIRLPDAVPQNQTRPLCVVMDGRRVYSISNWNLGIVVPTQNTHLEKVRDVHDVFLVIVWALLSAFIASIKTMEKASNWNHEDFRNPTQKENVFFELLDHQKSLIDFETSIKANHATLQNYYDDYGAELAHHQKLLVNNLIVESEQVAQMCDTFGKVLDATAVIAQSIVSNNLNDVMKTLTSLTIVFSLPTIITGLYMTNTQIPSPYNHFLMPVFLSVGLVVIGLLVFRKRKML